MFIQFHTRSPIVTHSLPHRTSAWSLIRSRSQFTTAILGMRVHVAGHLVDADIVMFVSVVMVITLKLVVPFKPARRFSDHGISLRLATNAAGVESSVSMSTAVASKLQNYVHETWLFSSSDVVFSAASCSPDLQKAQPRVLFPVSNFG